MVKGETVEPLISREEIAARVKALGAEIAKDYPNQPLTLMGTLKGATFFLSDLARELTPPDFNEIVELDFIKASSYGSSTESDGSVEIECPPSVDLAGRHVILVEDIIDTGYTAQHLLNYLKSRNTASLKLCSLLDKPARRMVEGVACDYLGFSIPDEFIVGYGLDYSQRYRNLPYIGVLKFDEKNTEKNEVK